MMTKHHRILIVDDEQEFTEIIAEYIRDLGHESFIVNEAAAVIDALRNSDIDVIIADNLMPEMSGLTLVEKIREEGFLQPVIFCSGYPPEWIGGSINNLNVVTFLEKQNLKEEQLEQAITKATAR